MSDTVKMRGKWFLTLYGPNGGVKDQRSGVNIVTTVGKEFLASFLQSAVGGAATFTGRYVGIGTNSTAEAVGDTGLGTEVARHTGTASYLSGQIFQDRTTVSQTQPFNNFLYSITFKLLKIWTNLTCFLNFWCSWN